MSNITKEEVLMMKSLLSKMEEVENNTPSQKADFIKKELKEFYLTLVPVDKDSFAKEIRKILDGFDEDDNGFEPLYYDPENEEIEHSRSSARTEILDSIPEKKIDFTDIKNLIQEKAKNKEEQTKVSPSVSIENLLSNLRCEAATTRSLSLNTIAEILSAQNEIIKKLTGGN